VKEGPKMRRETSDQRKSVNCSAGDGVSSTVRPRGRVTAKNTTQGAAALWRGHANRLGLLQRLVVVGQGRPDKRSPPADLGKSSCRCFRLVGKAAAAWGVQETHAQNPYPQSYGPRGEKSRWRT